MTNSQLHILIDQRSVEEAQYILENNSTVRGTAQHFKRNHNTVYIDLIHHLKGANLFLWARVRSLLHKNRMEAPMKAGMATKMKYLKLKEEANQ